MISKSRCWILNGFVTIYADGKSYATPFAFRALLATCAVGLSLRVSWETFAFCPAALSHEPFDAKYEYMSSAHYSARQGPSS